MGIAVELFGKTREGKEVKRYKLTNKNGVEADFLDYGAVLAGLLLPDKDGKLEDVALGYDSVEGYENTTTALGAFVGRNSNRLGNGVFLLNGKVYELEKNDGGKNNLHGGVTGYNKMMYQAKLIEEEGACTVEFSRFSPAGEQGFPGNVEVSVSYTLTDSNELVIQYLAVPDEDTIINLTNHSYFNLAGHKSGDVLKHRVMIYADSFTPADADMVPTGEVWQVEGTPMDFRKGKEIGQDIEADYEPLLLAGGYDHNYVLDKKGKNCVELAARAEELLSKRGLEVYTDRPGMQFYTGNFLIGEKGGKEGATYEKHGGLCFETQAYPDAPNKPGFPTTVVKAGEKFCSTTVYRFYLVP